MNANENYGLVTCYSPSFEQFLSDLRIEDDDLRQLRSSDFHAFDTCQ